MIRNVIYHRDALEKMRELKDASIDVVITDPPYCSGSVSEASRTAAAGQGLRSENIKRLGWFVGDNMGTAGLVWLLRSVAVESFRLLKQSGSFLFFCDWRMAPNLIPAIESAGFRYQNLVVWNKRSMGLGAGFRAQHELIVHMTCGSPKYYDKGTANVIDCPRVRSDERKHQTEKPVDLIAQLLRVVCPPGGIALDPFAGSCPIAEACVQTGRNFICIERDGTHVATGERRILTTQPEFASA